MRYPCINKLHHGPQVSNHLTSSICTCKDATVSTSATESMRCTIVLLHENNICDLRDGGQTQRNKQTADRKLTFSETKNNKKTPAILNQSENLSI